MKFRLLVFTATMVLSARVPMRADETPPDWNFKSAKANDAIRKYRTAFKKLEEAHEKSRKENRDSLIAKLQVAVKTATKDNDLDDALAIRESIKLLQGARPVEKQPHTAGKAQRVKPGKKDPQPDPASPLNPGNIAGRYRLLQGGVPTAEVVLNADQTGVVGGQWQVRYEIRGDQLLWTWQNRDLGYAILKPTADGFSGMRYFPDGKPDRTYALERLK